MTIISLKKLEFTLKKTFLWRELKLPVTPFAHWLKDYILTQMSSIEGGIADKTKVYIELKHQIGKRLERRHKGVTGFTQS